MKQLQLKSLVKQITKIALTEDMATRAELDAGTMKAVNVEQADEPKDNSSWKEVIKQVLGNIQTPEKLSHEQAIYKLQIIKRILESIIKEELSGITENEFDGHKTPKHNAKVTPEEESEALEIAKKIWGDTVKTAKFHSIDRLNGKHFWVTAHPVLNRTQYLCKQKDGTWIYSVGDGERSRWVKFKDEIKEMSSTGAAAGYSTPFAFSKNKEGSSRGIAAAKKYGKVVKSISKEEKK